MSFAYRSFAAAVVLFSVFLVANPASAQQAVLGKYTTKAALMPIGESPEAPTAELFYMAYTLDGADAGRRPITFCFNGGPGAASVYLHMAAIGPAMNWQLSSLATGFSMMNWLGCRRPAAMVRRLSTQR